MRKGDQFMTVIRALRVALCLAFASGAASPALARDPARIAITPASPGAAIIIKAQDVPIPPPYQTSYRLGLQTYDPVVQTMRGGPYSGSPVFAAKRKAFVDGYLILDVKPGTYAFRDFSRQDLWALCFNENSLQFTVKPGEILYLGELDAPGHVAELSRKAVMSGRTSTCGSAAVHFFDGVSAPAFAPVDEAGLAAAAAMVKARMPKSTVAPTAAKFTPARFGTGSDMFGLTRICGGYYQKRAK